MGDLLPLAPNRGDGHLLGVQAPILSPVHHLAMPHPAIEDRRPEVSVEIGGLATGLQEGGNLAKKFFQGVTRQPGEGRVRPGDPSFPVSDDDGVVSRFQSRALNAERCLSRSPCAAPLRLTQFPRHGAREPGQVALEDVVMSTALHHGHGGLFADTSGDHKEGNVQSGLLTEGERSRRIEFRHRVVGDDELPGPSSQRLPHCLGRLHPLMRRVEAGLPKLPKEQLAVTLGILDDQDTERHTHGITSSSAAADSGQASTTPSG